MTTIHYNWGGEECYHDNYTLQLGREECYHDNYTLQLGRGGGLDLSLKRVLYFHSKKQFLHILSQH